MAASIIIIILSLGLAVYWFRSTCLLLLDEANAEAVRFPLFSFPEARRQLAAAGAAASILPSLNRDFDALVFLLGRASLRRSPTRLLVWDYRLMRCWHVMVRAAFPEQGRRALAEMADVLAVLAGQIRESTAPAA